MQAVSAHPANEDLCARLEAIAALLEGQRATPFRVAAYRRAARTLGSLERPVADVFEAEGVEGLERLPGIGSSLASLLREYVRTGRISLLERLRGTVSPEAVLATVPGVGPVLAERIHDELGIETLEQLEAAVPTVGWLRCAASALGVSRALEASLAARLGRRARASRTRPSIAAVLDVDTEYRRRAFAGSCPASRRDVSIRRVAPGCRSFTRTGRDGR